MKKFSWQDAIKELRPHVVQIFTPRGSGTGFLVHYAAGKALCGIATAAHVVDHEHNWEQPIRIRHLTSGKTVYLRSNERAIFLDSKRDTALIVFPNKELPLPSEPHRLIHEGQHIKLGVEVGWLGFPAISPGNLCFFSGRTSSWIPEDTYLIDGVAINGVSGGPTFHIANNGEVRVIGVVSAYIPNRSTGESMPGLCVVRDVQQFQEMIKQFKNMDQAKQKEESQIATPPTSVAPTVPEVTTPASPDKEQKGSDGNRAAT